MPEPVTPRWSICSGRAAPRPRSRPAWRCRPCLVRHRRFCGAPGAWSYLHTEKDTGDDCVCLSDVIKQLRKEVKVEASIKVYRWFLCLALCLEQKANLHQFSVSLVTLPDRVLGRVGASWMKSGVAMAPIFSRTVNTKNKSRQNPVQQKLFWRSLIKEINYSLFIFICAAGSDSLVCLFV